MHGHGMAVIPTYILVQSAVPVPQVAEYLYIDMALSEVSGVVLTVEPATEDTVGMILALCAIAVQGYNADVCLFQAAELHELHNLLFAYLDLVALAIAFVPIHSNASLNCAAEFFSRYRCDIYLGDFANEVGHVRGAVVEPSVHLLQFGVEAFATDRPSLELTIYGTALAQLCHVFLALLPRARHHGVLHGSPLCLVGLNELFTGKKVGKELLETLETPPNMQ